MSLTLKQAAEAVGKTKPAILKAINNGKISASKNEHNQWKIEPAELFRVYQPIKEEKPVNENQQEKVNDGIQLENRLLTQEVNFLREQLQKAEEEKARLLGLVEKQTNLLEHHQQKKPFWKVF